MGFDRGCGRNSSGVGTLRVVFSFAFYSGCRVDQPNERVKPDQTRPDQTGSAKRFWAEPKREAILLFAWLGDSRSASHAKAKKKKRSALPLRFFAHRTDSALRSRQEAQNEII